MLVAGSMLLHNACGFERRILLSLRNYPMKLLLLVRAPPEQVCYTRREIALEILGTRESELEVNTKKLRARFAKELEHASQEGTLPRRLYWLLKGASIMLKPDVRENERLNKMIKLMDDRAPHSSMELKSSRLSLKYLLGQGGEANPQTSFRWSKFRPVAEKVRDHCLQGWCDLIDVQSNPMRWAPSTAAPDCIPNERALYLEGKLKPYLNCHSVQYTWAASYNMVLHRNLFARTEKQQEWQKLLPPAFCVAVRKSGQKTSSFRYFISAETVRKKHHVLEATREPDTKTLCWHRLSGFKPLLEIIKDHFDLVRAAHSVLLFHLELVSMGSLDSGAVNCATFDQTRRLVKLEQPTASFLKKMKAQEGQPDHQANLPELPTAASSEQGSVPPKPCDGADQEIGLGLLAEEAEARDLHISSDNSLEGDEPNGDDDAGETNDFHYYIAKGLLSSIQNQDAAEDELMEDIATATFKEQTSEDFVTSVEHSVAIQTIQKKACDIDSAEQQRIISQLQSSESNLDCVEAAMEAGFAKSAGVDAVDAADACTQDDSIQPGSSGFSVSL